MILQERLITILGKFEGLKILMVGDFFIDQYLFLDRRLSETSLETDLEAYQVQAVRNSLGAAGNVVNNLKALGAEVSVLGLIGKDANGWVMGRLMEKIGVDTSTLFAVEGLNTPTYMKPMMKERDGQLHELNRMDIKNRQKTQPEWTAQMKIALVNHISEVDGVLVTDQVQEADCGVVTEGMRAGLAAVAAGFADKPIWVDSRERSSLFSEVGLKMNYSEACQALGIDPHDQVDPESIARQFYAKNIQPVLITLGEKGSCYCDQYSSGIIPGIRVEGPIDIVGAGDSFMAAFGCAMCAGASLSEAALIGNLAASVTIQKIGTTGTATREELIEAFTHYSV